MATLSFAVLSSTLRRSAFHCQKGGMADDLRSCEGGRAGWTLSNLLTLCLAPKTHLQGDALVTDCQSLFEEVYGCLH